MNLVKKIRASSAFIQKHCSPSPVAWQGATQALRWFCVALMLTFFVTEVVPNFTWQKLLAFIVALGALLLAGILALQLLKLVAKMPKSFRFVLFMFMPFLLLFVAPNIELPGIAFLVALILVTAFAGAALGTFRQDGFRPGRQKVTLACVAIALALTMTGGYLLFGPEKTANSALETFQLADLTIDLPNPGVVGKYPVLTFSYGSGQDRYRPEFADEADVLTQSVDGSKLIDNWDGTSGWLRTKYWGFDKDELPLQARVWYPDGAGPFPLVLVVHGNHAMEDYSDPGYDYLGELLASRGYILASVDENFLNSSLSDAIDFWEGGVGLDEENDARGWLLLKHVQVWRDWTGESGHLMQGKADMDKIALIGHSRGGEAVAIAASFNALERYPDDATLAFDFGFNLRGVIAIAPVDGQYKPRERGTPIKDVNYFTIHGSMDGDVQSFMGTQQYSRVRFSEQQAPDNFNFKSSLYVAGANHGQFNTSWGNQDVSLFSSWMLDTGRIMDAVQQRQVAKVYFSAFLEVVMETQPGYLPLFADARRGANWLPDIFYLNQYEDARRVTIANFEEDIDPATASMPGALIESNNLTRWRETMVKLKWRDLDTYAAFVSWDTEVNEATARLDFLLPNDWLPSEDIGRLSFSLSKSRSDTKPRSWEESEDETSNDETTGEGEEEETDKAVEEDDEVKTLNWSVVLVDRNGSRASLPLDHDQVLYPQFEAKPRRADFLESNSTTEVLFRHYSLSLGDFSAANPEFDDSQLAKICFVFDRSESGSIIIDDLALSPAL